MVLYIRTMQKQLAPMGYHYKAIDIKGKQHLEHVIPQNKIITAYLHDKISAKIDNGVLKVLLPKAKSSLGRKISVK